MAILVPEIMDTSRTYAMYVEIYSIILNLLISFANNWIILTFKYCFTVINIIIIWMQIRFIACKYALIFILCKEKEKLQCAPAWNN